MLCYVHAREGVEVYAVAMCRNCGVGVCLTHLAELQVNRPGGTELDCPHVLPEPKDLGAMASAGREIGTRAL
jgi:hypothetical protein